MKITSESPGDFESSIDRFCEHLLTLEGPLKVSGSVRVSDGQATLLGSIEPYQSIPGFQYFYTKDWPCGDRIFDVSETINFRLLEEGRLVWFCMPRQPPCTHVLTLVYGVWAHNKEPVHNRFAFRGSDEEAFVLALQYGARLQKACDFFRTVR